MEATCSWGTEWSHYKLYGCVYWGANKHYLDISKGGRTFWTSYWTVAPILWISLLHSCCNKSWAWSVNQPSHNQNSWRWYGSNIRFARKSCAYLIVFIENHLISFPGHSIHILFFLLHTEQNYHKKTLKWNQGEVITSVAVAYSLCLILFNISLQKIHQCSMHSRS